MTQLPPLWDALIDVVEGREAPTSCEVVDGFPRFSTRPIPPKAKPCLDPLADVLRSGVTLPTAIRSWLADLLSTDATSEYRLELKRRGRGKPRADISRHWDAVARFHELLETTNQKQALYQAGEEYGLSEPTLKRAISGRAKFEERSENR